MTGPAFVLMLLPGAALAHVATHGTQPGPGVQLPVLSAIALTVWGYRRGCRRMKGPGMAAPRAAIFALGLALVAGLLLSPLDALGREMLSAHMVQHFALMLLAAPLLVLGRGGIALIWALPPGLRRGLPRLALLRRPVVAWMLYTGALWLWHLPPLYQAALRIPALHALQHASFLGAALVFWGAVLSATGPEAQARAFLAVFFGALQSCLLAALMTLSAVRWYPAQTGAAFGLTPAEDQQLAGLIMWVPCCAAMIAAGLIVIARLLAALETRRARSPT
ncbi:cytochrome c oxidase assembly protein [Frigidibacter sp. MR17.24]|uniref:cytochrome c oxidase assembly protein n=1 Tax=Frigidibacter sp. MR17.24 TaxID=3127345 RepID=UPI0030129FA0